MRFQLSCLGKGLFAVIAIVAIGCSDEKNTSGQTAPDRDRRSSIVQAPKIHRSAGEPIDPAQAASFSDVQPKTSADKAPGSPVSPVPEDPVSKDPASKDKENDNPHRGVVEPMSHVSQDDLPHENSADKPQAKHDSSQFAELISVPYMPDISLSSAQQATCLVGEGDTFPPLVLSDLSGSQQPLEKFFGKKLTVIVFSHPGDPFGIEQLDDLEPLVTARFGKQGVGIVAIGVRSTVQRSQDLVARLSLKFPMLLDPKGDAWGKLVSESAGLSARTFLLDAQGQIVWFDIEYSRTTRRDLVLAIRHHLR